MRVLIGVDGSSGSAAAVRFVGRLLHRDRDQLLLYYSPPAVAIRGQPTNDADARTSVRAALAERVFEQSRAELSAELREGVETVAGMQKAKHGLLIAADKYRSDLIVVGSRGAGMFQRLTMGSVSRAVVHGAMVPVLVVHDQPKSPPDTFRVLMACDRSASCADAKRFVSHFSWPENTSGDVLTVFETFVGQIPAWLEEELRANEAESMQMGHFEPGPDDKQRARADLEQWCQGLPPQFTTCTPRVAEGKPSQQILNLLQTNDYDLVIVGAHRRGPLGRAILGSTSEHVMTHAPCSVLIVPEHEQE